MSKSREENPSGAKAPLRFEGSMYGLKPAPLGFRSAPPGLRCSGPANPGLRCASPWAFFVFSLRETGAPKSFPFKILQEQSSSSPSSPGAGR